MSGGVRDLRSMKTFSGIHTKRRHVTKSRKNATPLSKVVVSASQQYNNKKDRRQRRILGKGNTKKQRRRQSGIEKHFKAKPGRNEKRVITTVEPNVK